MGVMHPCNYPGCMKKFDRKYNLKCHLRIHSNEKPYRCHHENCTRSFRWKSSLNHHLMSLDHTPASVRRARKARAQRRRIERTLPHTFVPQSSLDHHHPVFDLPTLSPVSSVATFSHTPSPQQRPAPHVSHLRQDHFKLEQRVNSSGPAVTSLPTAHGLQHFPMNHGYRHHPQEALSNLPAVYSHAPHYRTTPSQVTCSGQQRLDSHALLGPRLDHQQQMAMAHFRDPLSLAVKPLQSPLIPDPIIKAELRSFVEDSSTQRNASEADTSIALSTDDVTSLVTPSKKPDPLDFHTSGKVTASTPLVSIFEELSPVSPMSFSASLDTLFPAHMEGAGMKSF